MGLQHKSIFYFSMTHMNFKIGKTLFCLFLSITIPNVASVCDSSSSKRIIFPVVLYGCETWSLILRKERRLRVFENRVLRRIFGPKRDEVTWNGENYIMRNLMICTLCCLFSWRYNPLWLYFPQPRSGLLASSFSRFLDHTQRRATVGRTPLDE